MTKQEVIGYAKLAAQSLGWHPVHVRDLEIALLKALAEKSREEALKAYERV